MITTEKDFELFKQEFLIWLDKFGLKGYEINFQHKKIRNMCAMVYVQEAAKIANATLSKMISKTDLELCSIKDLAKHEAIHLLLNRLAWLGESRYISSNALEDEIERLVRVLEKNLKG